MEKEIDNILHDITTTHGSSLCNKINVLINLKIKQLEYKLGPKKVGIVYNK